MTENKWKGRHNIEYYKIAQKQEEASDKRKGPLIPAPNTKATQKQTEEAWLNAMAVYKIEKNIKCKCFNKEKFLTTTPNERYAIYNSIKLYLEYLKTINSSKKVVMFNDFIQEIGGYITEVVVGELEDMRDNKSVEAVSIFKEEDFRDCLIKDVPKIYQTIPYLKGDLIDITIKCLKKYMMKEMKEIRNGASDDKIENSVEPVKSFDLKDVQYSSAFNEFDKSTPYEKEFDLANVDSVFAFSKLRHIKKSKRGSTRVRRIKKSKSIPKKSKRGSTRVRRIKKSKSISKKSKRGSARVRRIKKSKSISKKSKRGSTATG
jgi:hypothetical protein